MWKIWMCLRTNSFQTLFPRQRYTNQYIILVLVPQYFPLPQKTHTQHLKIVYIYMNDLWSSHSLIGQCIIVSWKFLPYALFLYNIRNIWWSSILCTNHYIQFPYAVYTIIGHRHNINNLHAIRTNDACVQFAFAYRWLKIYQGWTNNTHVESSSTLILIIHECAALIFVLLYTAFDDVWFWGTMLYSERELASRFLRRGDDHGVASSACAELLAHMWNCVILIFNL